jgi:AmmeMemoRadiSam system protein B
MEREPAVAGRFYPGEPDRLRAEVARHLGAAPAVAPVCAIGVLAPHAGYMYSGPVAGATFASVEVPARAIVLCPNHTGLGAAASLWADGGWRTPLGRVPVDRGLAAALAACPLVEADHAAHALEHALEVELPFLQARRPDVAIAPLCLGPLDLEECEALGKAVAAAARSCSPAALVVASSDMSHYLPADEAERQDRRALDALLALDPERLHRTVRREGITMCGVVPATVMLFAARELGATAARLVRYASSGDVTGDRSSVVGYAGAIVT